MNIKEFKIKLKSYQKKDIIITYHADLRSSFRGINLRGVKNNILNPKRLVYFEEEKAKLKHERKFKCYFAYNKNLCYKYILTINRKVIIVTIIIINRNWQMSIRK